MKTCSRCKQRKSRADFYRLTTKADGLQNYCKPCSKAARKEYYRTANGYEAIAESNRHSRRADRRRWRRQLPKRKRAHDAVYRATKAGRLQRQPCEACGAQDAEGHHDDYDKPLDVRWLCARCHGRQHRRVA